MNLFKSSFSKWLALSLLASLPIQAANVVRNSGFEEGPKEWIFDQDGRGDGKAELSSENPHSGNSCARVERYEIGDSWMARQTYPAGSAKPEHYYYVSGWYRAPQLGVCRPTLYFMNAAKGFISAFETYLPASPTWKPFSFLITTPPGTDHLQLQLRAMGLKGVCWYDDVTLADGDEMMIQGQSLVQPLLKIAQENPDYLWALVADGGEVNWEFSGSPSVEVAWAVETRAGFSEGAAPQITAAVTSPQGKSTPQVTEINPKQSGIQRKRLALPSGGAGASRVLLKAESNVSGADRVMLVGVKADAAARDTLVQFSAKSFSVSNGVPFTTQLPWETRILPPSDRLFESIRDQNRVKLLRQALRVKEGESEVRLCSAWLNHSDDQWLDWANSSEVSKPMIASVSGVRNEYLSLQALFLPSQKPSQVSATLSDFKGSTKEVIPASACQVRMLEYVPFKGKWLPDPLLEGPSFTPSTHGQIVFWVTIHLPENIPAGDYKGILTINADKEKPVTREFSIRVWDAAIPSETHLRTSFWLFRDQIRRYFDLPTEVPMETYNAYIDLATSHRLSPIDVESYATEPLVKFYRETNGTITYDFTDWDKYLDRMKKGGANTIHLGTTQWVGRFFSDEAADLESTKVIDRKTGAQTVVRHPFGSKEHLDDLGNYLRAAFNHLKTRGESDKCYIEAWDEPQGENLKKCYTVLKGIKERVPEVPRLMTGIRPDVGEGMMKEVVNVWSPLTIQTIGGHFDEVRGRGDKLWWYICNAQEAPYSNFYVNWKVAEVRIMLWQTWQSHSTGFLYWGLNFWRYWAHPCTPEQRSFPKGPWSSSTEGPNTIGEGYFIYPGPTADKPLSSIRLETLRDGIEDYELLYLLNSKLEKASNLDEATRAKAKEILKVRSEVSKSLVEFDRNGVAMDREREAIVKLIQILSTSDQENKNPK